MDLELHVGFLMRLEILVGFMVFRLFNRHAGLPPCGGHLVGYMASEAKSYACTLTMLGSNLRPLGL